MTKRIASLALALFAVVLMTHPSQAQFQKSCEICQFKNGQCQTQQAFGVPCGCDWIIDDGYAVCVEPGTCLFPNGCSIIGLVKSGEKLTETFPFFADTHQDAAMMAQSSVAEGKHLMLLARVQILAKGLGPQFQINHSDMDSAGNPIKLTTLRINHTGNTLVLSFYEFDAEQIGKVKSKPELFNLYPTPKEVLTITGTLWAWKSLATGKTLNGDGIRPYAALSCKPPKS